MISTIHQPSSEIFMKFGSLLLLSQGNVVYCGKMLHAEQHFANFGLPVPDNYNPADFYMNVLSRDSNLKIDHFDSMIQHGT
mmetsp:Transcript_31366/g.5654  ORF Transcript_31366/g.5654 Transcript_31366/m.5654 type:complete len:81 (-) Transcript_31366:888-1130(-)